MVSDLADAARNLAFRSPRRVPALVKRSKGEIREIGEIAARYYLRLSLLDKPGVLGQIASLLGQNHISIASVLQKEGRAGDYVPVVIVTHFAKERDFQTALKEIGAIHVLGAKPVRFRIEDMLNHPPAGSDSVSGAEAVKP